MLNRNSPEQTISWFIHTTALLYLAGSVFIMVLDLVGSSPLKDFLLLCFMILCPLSVIVAACIYFFRRKSYAALGWWFALVFLIGNLSVSFSYLFLPTGMESVWDPIGGFWGVNTMAFSLFVALPMATVDFFSKQARLRGLVGIILSLATFPLVQAVRNGLLSTNNFPSNKRVS